jgi:uncharacterized protein
VRALYDVNVLIALFDPQHTQHAKATAWHAANTSGWASCPITQNGLLRIVSQPRYTNPAPVAVLLKRLAQTTSSQSHQFWADDVSLASEGVLRDNALVSSGALTDLYLLALAVHHSGRLITLDTRIRSDAVIGATPAHLVTL